MVRNPWREAFLSANIKYILVAIVVLIGQGVVWYSGQFWALYFLQTVKKLDVLTSSYLVGAALLLATPTLFLFGWLYDIIGRKPVILGGMFLASVPYSPLYAGLGQVTNPGAVNYPAAIFIIFILVSYVGMVYGPVGAFLAEYFPSRIRYTSVSVPYHIGNGWGGGLVPLITSAAFLSSRSVADAVIASGPFRTAASSPRPGALHAVRRARRVTIWPAMAAQLIQSREVTRPLTNFPSGCRAFCPGAVLAIAVV